MSDEREKENEIHAKWGQEFAGLISGDTTWEV